MIFTADFHKVMHKFDIRDNVHSPYVLWYHICLIPVLCFRFSSRVKSIKMPIETRNIYFWSLISKIWRNILSTHPATFHLIICHLSYIVSLNILRPSQNDHHFADDIVKCIFCDGPLSPTVCEYQSNRINAFLNVKVGSCGTAQNSITTKKVLLFSMLRLRNTGYKVAWDNTYHKASSHTRNKHGI